jgi:hypothetical protein
MLYYFRMKKISSVFYFYVVTAIIVIGLIGFAVTRDRAPSQYDSYAQCLTDNGVKMYGAWWCPHCENQKNLFGSSFSNIDYIECSAPGSRAMNQVCKNAGIEGYPTWEFSDGSRVSGEQPLAYLGERGGCDLPSDL